MARYPAFKDYEKKRNFHDGIKRCNELLAKSPGDIQLLTTKFRLLHAVYNRDEASRVLDEIATIQPHELQDIIAPEQAVVDSQRNVYPRPSTAGPVVAKMWDTAIKGSITAEQKLDIASVRFERAVLDDRLVDAQQALIQLKAIQPRNRVIYMAHAAFTQLISASNEDLQARLAMGLARKAVKERFDGEKELDCRVPGQIFASQGAEKDLEGVEGGKFGESKHVFDARRKMKGVVGKADGVVAKVEVPEPGTVPTQEWMTAEISSLKRTFTDLIESNAPIEAMRAFATNAIRLLDSSTTTLSANARRSPADICFLAISALVRMFELSSQTRYLLHAAYLAETLLRHNEHIHEARLSLVYLYMRLNLGSLAMKLFDSLSVKEVQHDTVGHVLFTRLSRVHPHATHWGNMDDDTMLPFKRTAHALNVYLRCEEKLAENEASVLSHGQTGMIFDLQELRNALRTSLPRRIMLLEHRQIARLTKGVIGGEEAAEAMGPLALETWIETKDTRDFDAAFNYSYDVERLLHRHGSEEIPGRAWTLFALAADSAWCIATQNSTLVTRPEEILHQIYKLRNNAESPAAEGKPQDMTGVEYLAGNVSYYTLTLLTYAHPAHMDYMESIGVDQITAVNQAIDDLAIDELMKSSDDLAERLPEHYAYADVFNTLAIVCRFVEIKVPPSLAKQLGQLQARAKRLFAGLQRHTIEQQAAIKQARVRRSMEQDQEVWAALMRMSDGEKTLDGFCEEVASSAKEGWEGMMKLKVL
ncbi:hypothetical protein LTR10_010038 [Elasticomyces elasticus]|nr:hypothetical protein LTR10_010038 [Elasticomyces elasticus]KAK4970330.1 hypothetical protein LTR42_008497 [Elasticomyces elasticus]